MHAFSVMAKPASSACNLTCRYCYYLHRADKPPARRMAREVLEAYVRDTIAAQPEVPEIVFGWQGGEPTLAGLEFFEEAVALQERHRPAATRIVNALQTNGTLIDEDWAWFFREHNFLVGLSLDGPAHFHDPLRRDLKGRGSHARALRALSLLSRAGVEVNTLTVVHRLNYQQGREVYRFLRRIGAHHMQFIPLVERTTDGIAPWTAPRAGFGKFLCDVFDDWRARDVGRVFVQIFEEYANVLAGFPARLCVFAADCRGTPILEANGDLYSCDHYAYPGYRLGNILEAPIGELARSERQLVFGRTKTASLPEECTRCEFLAACFGGCPKHRFASGGTTGRRANYLCPSYRSFFAHAGAELPRL